MTTTPDLPAAVSCSICSGDLIEGQLRMESSLLGFLAVGLSYQHLCFQARDSGADDEIILSSLASQRAYKCTKCSSVVMPGKG